MIGEGEEECMRDTGEALLAWDGMNWCVDGAPSLAVARSSVGFTAYLLRQNAQTPPTHASRLAKEGDPYTTIPVRPARPPKLPTSRRRPAQRM